MRFGCVSARRVFIRARGIDLLCLLRSAPVGFAGAPGSAPSLRRYGVVPPWLVVMGLALRVPGLRLRFVREMRVAVRAYFPDILSLYLVVRSSVSPNIIMPCYQAGSSFGVCRHCTLSAV